MFIPEPKKDDTGTFHCENCGMIISYKAHYCDECNAKRSKKLNVLLKKYWWLIVVFIIIILIVVI